MKYLLILLLFSSCLSKKAITFKTIDNLNYTTENNVPKLTFDLVLNNPNNWGLRITDVNTNVSVEDKVIGNTNLPNSIKIKRKSDVAIPIQLNLSMQDMITLLPQGLSIFTGKKTTLKTSVDGGITLKKFLFRKRLVVNFKQDLVFK